MKRTLTCLLTIALLQLLPVRARSQSTMEFQPGTSIEVAAGADICADIVAINGGFLGGGTQCAATFPPNLVTTITTTAMEFTLGPNFPNPFNPSTTIEFTLAEAGKATLKIYDMLGREVATPFSQAAEAGKIYRVQFNSSGLTSGVYVTVLESGGKRLVKRMTLVK